MTRLVLTNAIYFKGTWASEFDKNATHNESFRTISGRTVEVPMMRRIGEYAYLETQDAQILRMPYKGDNISMMIDLPKKDDGISSIEGSLSSEKLAEWSVVWMKHRIILRSMSASPGLHWMRNIL